MHRFRVWAPSAGKIRVEVAGAKHALEKRDGGWWEADVSQAQAGMDYAFFLDDQDLALPDPRSLWQPQGVHGPSRILDHSEFRWTDAGWEPPPLSSAVVYELHVGTFTPEGTFDAAQTKLDDLRDLGITHVQLMPVNAFPGVQGWGYDGVDLFAPHQPYGGPEALKRFVNACHAKGLAVLLDVVYNHLGPAGNHLAKFGPYFTAAHHTPWGDAVNFEDRGSHEVRRFFCDNALMWLRDYHFDGLRLDAVHAYTDRSAINFMEQLGAEVHALEAQTGRNYVVVAESDLNDPRVVTAREAGGYGLDAQWSDDFHHALFSALTGTALRLLCRFWIARGYRESSARGLCVRRPLLAVSRPHPRAAGGESARHALPGLRAKSRSGGQSRQRRADRATGEPRPRRRSLPPSCSLRRLCPCCFRARNGPHRLPSSSSRITIEELGKLISEGRKKEFAAFGWNPDEIPDPQSPATFERSKLNWDERSRPPHAEMLDWYKRLIALRRTTPDLNDPDLGHVHVRCSEKEKWLVMERGAVTVAFSLAEKPVQLEVRPGSKLVLASSAEVQMADRSLVLPPDSVAVLKAT